MAFNFVSLAKKTHIKTHPNFKSVVPDIYNAQDIQNIMCEALMYQEDKRIDRRTLLRPYVNLRKFKIDLKKIDRVYYIRGDNRRCCQYSCFCCIERKFYMLIRMEYENSFLYVEFFAYFDIDELIRGRIFVSRDANLFMKLVLSESENRYLAGNYDFNGIKNVIDI